MVQWTSEKDQLLLKGVFQFCDIKCSGPLLKHLADMIGEDCTPKAVSHRLNNIKSTGKMVKTGDIATPTGTPTKASFAKTPTKTPAKTPCGRGKAAKKVNDDADADAKDPVDGEKETPKRTRGASKPKQSAEVVDEEDEEDNESPAKKIKAEPQGFDDIVSSGIYGGEPLPSNDYV